MFLDIPTIPVHAYVEEVRVTHGQMDVPGNPRNVGRYQNVIAGHLNTPYGDGVFSELKRLRRGDIIMVENNNFVVQRRRLLKANSSIPVMNNGILLITCAGRWDGWQYSHRLIIYAYEI